MTGLLPVQSAGDDESVQLAAFVAEYESTAEPPEAGIALGAIVRFAVGVAAGGVGGGGVGVGVGEPEEAGVPASEIVTVCWRVPPAPRTRTP